MPGHSKWANIQRREGAQAALRCRRAADAPCEGRERVHYEGYGPGGAAVVVECVTSDRTRMGAEVRRAFAQHGGRLGADGSVSYLFNTVGLLTYPPATAEVTRRAATSLELSGEEAESMVQLLEALERLEDVRDVYSNVEISDEVLARF